MTSPSSWSDLPVEILLLIFDFAKDPIDILRCGAVCKSWLPTALQVYRRFFPLCFIQPEKDIDDNLVFFNILNKETRKIHLPEAMGKCICCSCNGWLLIVDDFGFPCGMHLLKIFSRTQILLPPSSSLPISFPDPHDKFRSIHFQCKLLLSGCPTVSDCMILLLLPHGSHDESPCAIAFCKPGDESWAWFLCKTPDWKISDAILNNGSIYASRKFPPAVISVKEDETIPVPEPILTHNIDGAFLVNSLNGHLLLVCYRREDPDGKLFDVFEFVISTEECNEVNDLDGCTLFMSPNGNHLAKTGMIETSFKGNCIYFFRHSEGDYLIYDMETRHSEIVPSRGLPGDGSSLILWVNPDV
ncbi:hypothetical protein QUC31_002384 [Theobroma cacao]